MSFFVLLVTYENFNEFICSSIRSFIHLCAVMDPGFPRAGAPTLQGGTNIRFGQMFPKIA